jgi:Ser/Thr protein kinase RdoA (MazF antagonist)
MCGVKERYERHPIRGQTRGVADEMLSRLRAALTEQAGMDVVALRPADSGESKSTFLVTDRAGTVSVLKILPDPAAEGADYLRTLDEIVRQLRRRGYPAPRLGATGRTGGLLYWVQEWLPGTPLDHGVPGSVLRLLPEVFRLNDAQAGLGTGKPGWRELIVRTLTVGGDGYCLHDTLSSAAPEILRAVRRIGERNGPAIPDGGDFVHYDFSLANLLSDGTSITAVIDINPPALAGDRAFDLATLLFYVYDHEEIRRRLWARILKLTSRTAAEAYLAHMVLRQVEWSLRHYPGAAMTQRHVRLGTLIVDDIGRK